MNPLHRVTDPEKVQTLAQSMEEHGWQGAPLVIWPVYEQLLTGVHRFTAAHEELGWDYSEIPTIDIADVFREDGLDFEQVLEEEGFPSYASSVFGRVIQRLSPSILEKYGIDIH